MQDSDNYDVDFDAEEEAAELKKFREACEDEEFPDEIDTPTDVAARIRFQKLVFQRTVFIIPVRCTLIITPLKTTFLKWKWS